MLFPGVMPICQVGPALNTSPVQPEIQLNLMAELS